MQKLKEEFAVKKKEFAETLDELDVEIKSLEVERDELRKKLSYMGGRRPGLTSTSGSGSLRGDASSADLRAAYLQVHLMQQSLGFTRQQLAEAQAANVREELTHLSSLQTCKPLPATLKDAGQLVKEAVLLNRDLLTTCASVRVVDISRQPSAKPGPRPKAQIAATVAKMRELQLRSERLRASVLPVLARATGQTDAYFGSNPTLDYERVAQERANPSVVARCTLPEALGIRGKRIRVGPSELRALHQVFV
jgi:hypothetical protein